MESRAVKIINEMGRERTEAKEKFEALRPRIVEHLWKVYAYHTINSRELNGWITSLNKYLIELRRYNVQRGNTKKLNLTKTYFTNKLVKEDFESLEDITIIENEWNAEGYKRVYPSSEDLKKLQSLATQFIECIFNTNKFNPSKNDLSQY